jgi:excisionase family DNA binding protein
MDVAQKISYRIPEAMAVTGIKRSKLFALLKAGDLKAVKVGGCTLIPRTELLRLLTTPE